MTQSLSADQIIETLDLSPHPEGGYFKEIYRSDNTTQGRSVVTTIYFLLKKGDISRWHQVDADEIWHHYSGAPLELWIMDKDFNSLNTREINSIENHGSPVEVVHSYEWQAARSLGEYTLVGCTVAPGFHFEGFKFLPDDSKLKDALRLKFPGSESFF